MEEGKPVIVIDCVRKENLSSINKNKNKERNQGRDKLEGSGGECPVMGETLGAPLGFA